MAFLSCAFVRLTYLESDKSDDSDEEESNKFGSGSKSGSFGTFGTGLGMLFSGLEFSRGVMLDASDNSDDPPP